MLCTESFDQLSSPRQLPGPASRPSIKIEHYGRYRQSTARWNSLLTRVPALPSTGRTSWSSPARIDDVTDSLEDILLRLYMFRITSLREDAVSFVSIICDCCCALKKLMVEFPEFRKSKAIKDMIIEINHLEENGDKLYTEAMRRLYSECRRRRGNPVLDRNL